MEQKPENCIDIAKARKEVEEADFMISIKKSKCKNDSIIIPVKYRSSLRKYFHKL